MVEKRCSIHLLIAMVLGTPVAALAATPQLSGYLSQGIIYSGDNPFFDDDAGLNFNLRELGLNVNWNTTDRLRFAGQITSRKAGVLEDGDPKLDFLLVDYRYYQTENLIAGLRMGRAKIPYGFYNTTRDVPHGRTGVFVPQSVYFESLRNALLSADGGELYFEYSNSLADISAHLLGGEGDFENESIEYLLFQVDMPGEFNKTNDAYGMSFTIEPRAFMQGARIGYSRIDLTADYKDAPEFTPFQGMAALNVLIADQSLFPNYITSMQLDGKIQLYSLQYAPGDWIFTAEYLKIDVALNDLDIVNVPVSGLGMRTDYEENAFYLQSEWLFSVQLSLYARYEELYYNADDKDGKEYAATNGGNPVTQYTKAFTVGARWYFTPDLSLTVEYSTNEGAAIINGQAEVDYDLLEEDWDMTVLQISYHF